MNQEEFEAMTTPAEREEMRRDEKREFFTVTSRAIVEHLRRTYKPTDTELSRWLTDPSEIDQRVKGTEFEVTLSNHPPVATQRTVLLVSLSQIGKSL